MAIRATSIIAILFWSISFLFSQKHDYKWIFGYNDNVPNPPITSELGRCIIDFSSTPTSVAKSYVKLNFASSASTMSDSIGQLLYYTNGFAIRNFDYNLIENGDSINYSQWWAGDVAAGTGSVVGGFSLPYPGHPGQFYYFHQSYAYVFDTAWHFHSTPDYYTIIDMNANNGMGKVLAKNQVLFSGDLGWPAACKHGNGRDWWITFYALNSSEQRTYLLSPTGLTGPVVQEIGPNFPQYEIAGKCVYSPDGHTYVRNDSKNGLRITDFDRCTGLFSNMRILPYPPEIYTWSAAFSPNSRFLYLSNPSTIWKLDLQAQDLSASLDTVLLFNGSYCPTPFWTNFHNQMQEGADGKIYIANASSSRCMNRIEQPNLPGQAADMAYGSFELPRWNYWTMCNFPNYRLGEHDGSPCDTINFQKPGDGFVATPYRKEGTSSVYRGSKDDYTILPMLHAEPDEAARREKREFVDPRNIRNKVFDGRDLSRKPGPEDLTPIHKDDPHE